MLVSFIIIVIVISVIAQCGGQGDKKLAYNVVE